MGYVWAWIMSGILHMAVGGYICYRFRAQIDSLRGYAEYAINAVAGRIPYVSKAVAAVWNLVMSKVGK